MLNQTVQPQLENSSNSETDLGALAEHLSIIADALRKTTTGPHNGGKPLSPALEVTENATIGVQGAPTLAQHSGADALASASLYTSDLKIRRRRYAKMAKDAYAVRRRRGAIFASDDIFGEPAWDILLDLYVAHAEGKPVSVSSACIGSAAPPTTGLRWLGVLAEQELVLRQHDPEDQRRVLVCLTEKGLTAMDEYFSSTGMAA